MPKIILKLIYIPFKFVQLKNSIIDNVTTSEATDTYVIIDQLKQLDTIPPFNINFKTAYIFLIENLEAKHIFKYLNNISEYYKLAATISIYVNIYVKFINIDAILLSTLAKERSSNAIQISNSQDSLLFYIIPYVDTFYFRENHSYTLRQFRIYTVKNLSNNGIESIENGDFSTIGYSTNNFILNRLNNDIKHIIRTFVYFTHHLNTSDFNKDNVRDIYEKFSDKLSFGISTYRFYRAMRYLFFLSGFFLNKGNVFPILGYTKFLQKGDTEQLIQSIHTLTKNHSSSSSTAENENFMDVDSMDVDDVDLTDVAGPELMTFNWKKTKFIKNLTYNIIQKILIKPNIYEHYRNFPHTFYPINVVQQNVITNNSLKTRLICNVRDMNSSVFYNLVFDRFYLKDRKCVTFL